MGIVTIWIEQHSQNKRTTIKS